MPHFKCLQNLCSLYGSVGKVPRLEVERTVRSSNPNKERDFSLHQTVQAVSGAHTTAYSTGTGFLYRGKAAEA